MFGSKWKGKIKIFYIILQATPIWRLEDLIQEPSWKIALQMEFRAPYFQQLERTLQQKYVPGITIYPPRNLIFNAFTTPLPQIKVVIMGQDPYHGQGQAHGLAFSVPVGVPIPPSLQTMYQELARDIPGFTAPNHGCLQNWAQQGVMLLNAVLTVEANNPNSHAGLGWQWFTDAVIRIINHNCDRVAFLLFGYSAQSKAHLIDPNKHKIITAYHPSYAGGSMFLGSGCFSQANAWLSSVGKPTVRW